MAKKYMKFIRKAGGQKAKKLLAVILAAGMAMRLGSRRLYTAHRKP